MNAVYIRTPYFFWAGDGGSMFLQNVGIYLQIHMA
jgi:hypothetical protein